MESVDDVLDDRDNKNDGRVALYIRALIWSLRIFDFGHDQSPAPYGPIRPLQSHPYSPLQVPIAQAGHL